MKSKRELIEISYLLDTRADYGSCYSFAANYIDTLILKKKNSSDFFNAVTTLGNNSDVRQNITFFGKQGKDSWRVIKEWCIYIVNNEHLKELTINELHYVMGYCARRAKICKGA